MKASKSQQRVKISSHENSVSNIGLNHFQFTQMISCIEFTKARATETYISSVLPQQNISMKTS